MSTSTTNPAAMSQAQMQAEIARLIAENTALKAKPNGRSLSLKVSEKGGLSIYGMGRFPVTLYKEQWLKLAEFMPTVQAFIKTHDSALVTKAQSEERKAITQ